MSCCYPGKLLASFAFAICSDSMFKQTKSLTGNYAAQLANTSRWSAAMSRCGRYPLNPANRWPEISHTTPKPQSETEDLFSRRGPKYGGKFYSRSVIAAQCSGTPARLDIKGRPNRQASVTTDVPHMVKVFGTSESS